MQGWYKYASNRPPTPARVTIECMMADRVELHQNAPSTGRTIAMILTPFPVEESVPDDKDISWVVRRLCLNHFWGPSGMRAEHLYKWL